MEKSQERFSYARDGKVKLQTQVLDPITLYLNFKMVNTL